MDHQLGPREIITSPSEDYYLPKNQEEYYFPTISLMAQTVSTVIFGYLWFQGHFLK